MESGIHELSAGYALDALDADERRRFEEHLAECDRCREDVSAFWGVTGALAVAAPSAEPPPELRERILASARAEGQNVIPLAPRRERRQFLVPAVAAVAAAAAAVAIGLGLYSASLSNDLDEARSAVALLSDPDAEVVALQEGRGRLVVRPDGDAALVLAGLPARPDKTYAVWVIEGETPEPAGLFDDASDATVVQVERPVPEGAVVAVTVEDGPVDAPTSTPIVASEPV
jgi:anti-sigma-K factor RskA